MDSGWSRNARTLTLIAAIILVVLLLYAARQLLGPLVVAALLAYVLNPLVAGAQRRSRLPRKILVPLLYLLFLVVLLVLGILFAPLLIAEAHALSEEFETITLEFQEQWSQQVVVLGIEVSANEFLGDTEAVTNRFFQSDRILLLLRATTTNLAWVLVILVTTYYLLQDWDQLRDWLFRQAPPAARQDIERLYQEIKLIWQSYVRGQLVLMSLMGLLTGVALAAIGLPGAAVVGLLTGLLDVIPTLGPSLAMLVAGLVAWLEGSSYLPLPPLWFALLAVLVHGLIQGLENVWLRPQIMSRSIQLHPAIIFLGIVAALYLVGILGALIVVPLLGTAAVLGSYLRRRILGLPPWPSLAEEADRIQDATSADLSDPVL